jgi:hypothetical protein
LAGFERAEGDVDQLAQARRLFGGDEAPAVPRWRLIFLGRQKPDGPNRAAYTQ